MSVFKTDQLYINGRAMNRSLFVEFSGQGNTSDKYTILTLQKENRDGFPSLYKHYVTHCSDDPTEFTFADRLFGSWDFWVQLSESPDIKSYVDKWREENRIRQKAKALKLIMEEALDEKSKSKFQAAKFLWTEGFIKDQPKKTTLKDKNNVVDFVGEDMKRLNLIKG